MKERNGKNERSKRMKVRLKVVDKSECFQERKDYTPCTVNIAKCYPFHYLFLTVVYIEWMKECLLLIERKTVHQLKVYI